MCNRSFVFRELFCIEIPGSLGLIGWRLVLSQVVLSVSCSPECRCRSSESLVSWRFKAVVHLVVCAACSRIPRYAMACVIVDSFAPWTS